MTSDLRVRTNGLSAEKPLHVSFVALGAYPLFEPAARGATGGMEKKAWMFARALAERGTVDVSFVVRDHGQPAVKKIDDVSVFAYREPLLKQISRVARSLRRKHPITGNIAKLASGAPPIRKAPLTRLPLRVARASCKLVWQIMRGMVPAPALYARIGADVHIAAGVNAISAEMVAACRINRSQSILWLASDSDLDPAFVAPGRGERADGLPGTVGHYALTNANAIIVQSLHQQALLRERFGRESHLIRNAIDLTGDDTQGGTLDPEIEAILSKGPYALWVGRSDPIKKRPDVCFDLAEKLPHVRFVIVMALVKDTAFHAALKRRKPANVDLIEGLPFRAMPHLFRSAVALVNTSSQEGFPNAFLEAGKHGIPVVSLNVDPDSMFSKRQAGIVCRGNLDAMAAAVQKVHSDAEERRQYASRLRAYAAEFHGLEECCDELCEVIRSTTTVNQDSPMAGSSPSTIGRLREFCDRAVRGLTRRAQRAAIAVRAHFDRRTQQIISEVVCATETPTFVALRTQSVGPDFDSSSTETFLKYFDARRFVPINVRRAMRLGLDQSAGRRILDIGCGFGYFMRVCHHFGHEAVGMDFEDENEPSTQVYRSIFSSLPFERVVHRIEKYQPLPHFAKRFDLIVAYQICFNRHNSPDRWGVGEWKYFLSELRGLLSEKGEVFLHFNRPDGWVEWHTPELAAFFRELGAVMQDGKVHFHRRECLPAPDVDAPCDQAA